jgi:hypothetical protein
LTFASVNPSADGHRLRRRSTERWLLGQEGFDLAGASRGYDRRRLSLPAVREDDAPDASVDEDAPHGHLRFDAHARLLRPGPQPVHDRLPSPVEVEDARPQRTLDLGDRRRRALAHGVVGIGRHSDDRRQELPDLLATRHAGEPLRNGPPAERPRMDLGQHREDPGHLELPREGEEPRREQRHRTDGQGVEASPPDRERAGARGTPPADVDPEVLEDAAALPRDVQGVGAEVESEVAEGGRDRPPPHGAGLLVDRHVPAGPRQVRGGGQARQPAPHHDYRFAHAVLLSSLTSFTSEGCRR